MYELRLSHLGVAPKKLRGAGRSSD